MLDFIRQFFKNDVVQKKPSFERRNGDRRKNQESIESYGIGDDCIERRAYDDRRRDHGIESKEH